MVKSVKERSNEVIERIIRADDLELHVKHTVIDVEGMKDPVALVSLREYVPSRDWYGRGVTFPVEDLEKILAALDVIYESTDAPEAVH